MLNKSYLTLAQTGPGRTPTGGTGHARARTTRGDYSNRRPAYGLLTNPTRHAPVLKHGNPIHRASLTSYIFYSTQLYYLLHTYSNIFLFRLWVQVDVPHRC